MYSFQPLRLSVVLPHDVMRQWSCFRVNDIGFGTKWSGSNKLADGWYPLNNNNDNRANEIKLLWQKCGDSSGNSVLLGDFSESFVLHSISSWLHLPVYYYIFIARCTRNCVFVLVCIGFCEKWPSFFYWFSTVGYNGNLNCTSLATMRGCGRIRAAQTKYSATIKIEKRMGERAKTLLSNGS